MIVLVKDLRINSVEFFFRKKSQKLPALIQGFGDASVLGFGLADKFTLKGFTKYQIAFIQRGKLILTDNGSKGSGISNLCIEEKS